VVDTGTVVGVDLVKPEVNNAITNQPPLTVEVADNKPTVEDKVVANKPTNDNNEVLISFCSFICIYPTNKK